MIFKYLWERYLFKETLKIFFLFLFCSYFLYALIDYSLHMQEIIKNQRISFQSLSFYYLMLFSKRLDLLFPLAILIATLKVLLSMNKKHELIALQIGSLSIQKLMRPFFLIAFFCLSICYINLEFGIPKSTAYLSQFEKEYLRNTHVSKRKQSPIKAMPLNDGGRLIYQKSSTNDQELLDVYWLPSAENVWHIKKLVISGRVPIGYKVDHLQRNADGLFEKMDSHETYQFKTLKLNADLKCYITKPMDCRSMTELFKMLKKHQTYFLERKDMIETHLYYKLLLPWLSVLVVVCITPFAVRFSRNQSSFLIFSLAIFGYIALFTVLDASVILGEAHVVSPFLALFTIPTFMLLFFGKKFLRMG